MGLIMNEERIRNLVETMFEQIIENYQFDADIEQATKDLSPSENDMFFKMMQEDYELRLVRLEPLT